MTSRTSRFAWLRRVGWATIAVWAVALGLLTHARSRTATDRRAVVTPEPLNQQLTFPAGRVRLLSGGVAALVPPDSDVALLFLDARCRACRLDAPLYSRLDSVVRRAGVGLRFIVVNDGLRARQFAGLLPKGATVVPDPRRSIAGAARVDVVPSLIYVDSRGILRRRWTPLAADFETIVAEVLRFVNEPRGHGHASNDRGS